MKKTHVKLLLFFLVLNLGCDKWNLEEQVFLQVQLAPIETISIDSVTLSAELIDFTNGQIQTHGFLWTTLEQVPTITLNDGVADLLVKTSGEADQTFSATIRLEANKKYLIRAFASLDQSEYVYSEALPYITGNAMVFSEGIDYKFGKTLKASGRLSGMDKGFVALEHGFCWSTTNPLPTIDDNVENLGERQNNQTFETEFNTLINDVSHYFRAYALVSKDDKLETIYGEVMEFDGNLKSVWTVKASVPGAVREGAVAFAIGNKGYVGLGNSSNLIWEYDALSDSWEEIATFPGPSRWGAVSFTIGNKGYITTGMRNDNGTNQVLNDLWEYDPATDSWEQKASLPGPARVRAVGFSIGNRAYLATGWNGGSSFFNDLWTYDPEIDTWEEKNNLPIARFEAQAFALNGKGYITMGAINFVETTNDLIEYDPTSDTWNAKAPFPLGGRAQGASFSIETKSVGYIVCGRPNLGGCEQEIWAYNPAEDNWRKEETDFPAVGRLRPIAFSIGDRGYFGTGGCLPIQFAWNDLWEYDP